MVNVDNLSSILKLEGLGSVWITATLCHAAYVAATTCGDRIERHTRHSQAAFIMR